MEDDHKKQVILVRLRGVVLVVIMGYYQLYQYFLGNLLTLPFFFRLIMYCFVNDIFMVPDDPLGRFGQTLEQILNVPDSRRYNNEKSMIL